MNAMPEKLKRRLTGLFYVCKVYEIELESFLDNVYLASKKCVECGDPLGLVPREGLKERMQKQICNYAAEQPGEVSENMENIFTGQKTLVKILYDHILGIDESIYNSCESKK